MKLIIYVIFCRYSITFGLFCRHRIFGKTKILVIFDTSLVRTYQNPIISSFNSVQGLQELFHLLNTFHSLIDKNEFLSKKKICWEMTEVHRVWEDPQYHCVIGLLRKLLIKNQ